MKYSAFLFALLAVFLLLIPGPADAEEVAGWNPDITWSYDAQTHTLTLTGKGEIVLDGFSPWEAFEDEIEHVVIGEGITGIGSRIFDRHRYLKDVVMPKSLTSIGEYAFQNCYSLRSIDLSNITHLGNYVFEYAGLRSVTIPEAITVIPRGLFQNCGSLAEVTFHDKLTEIKSYAFAHCDKLETVQLPGSLKILGESAFADCRILKDIRFNDGLEVIGYAAVRNCPALESIVIPDSVKEVDGCVFNGCTNLKSIHFGAGISSLDSTSLQNTPSLITYTVSPAHTYLEVYQYGLYLKQTRELISVARGYEGAFAVKEGTVSIGYCACDAGKITSLTIPDSVKTIGLRAFFQCAKLQTLDLGEGVETFKDSVFVGCPITELVLPASVKKIGHGVFFYCTSLQKITFEGLPPESEWAFYDLADVVAYYPGYMEEWADADIRKQNFLNYTPDCKDQHNLRWEVFKEPTCTEPGWRSECWCIVCRQNVHPEGELAPTGHSYGPWTQISAPTAEKEGLSRRTCSTCGAKDEKILEKLQPPSTDPTGPTDPEPSTDPTIEPTTAPTTEPTTEPTQTQPSEPTQPGPEEPQSIHWLAYVFAAAVSIGIGMIIAFLLFRRKRET